MVTKKTLTAAVMAVVVMAVTTVTVAIDIAAASDRPLLCAMSAASWWAYLVIAAAGIAAGIGCTLLVRHLLGANERKQSHPPAQEGAGADAAELVAQTDGREIALGPLSKVHRFSIGSGPHAAVPLTGNGIRARHISLQRDGGTFRLCNRSRRPIRVNGVTVCGGGRCRLVLPAEIRIDGNKTVILHVQPEAWVPDSDSSRAELRGHVPGPQRILRMNERSRFCGGIKTFLKTALITFIVTAATTMVSGAPNNAASSDRPLEVWLLVDTSPSTKGISQELRTVADATLRALMPGDRLRILSAHSDRPRVRVIETIGPDRGRYPEIRRALEEIRPAFVLKADLAAALQIPLQALQESPASASRSVLFILTDGKIDDDHAERVLTRVKEIEALGARVICMALATSNRSLLVAAAQGRLHWAQLAESNPAEWLADARRSAPSPTAPASPPAVTQASDVTEKAAPSPPHAAQEPTAAAKPAPSPAPEPPRVPAPAAPAQASQPLPPASSQTTITLNLPTGLPYWPFVPPAVTSPLPSESKPETPSPGTAGGPPFRASPAAPLRAPDQEAPPAPSPPPAVTSPSSPTPTAVLAKAPPPDILVKPPTPLQGSATGPRGSLAPTPTKSSVTPSPEPGRTPRVVGLGTPNVKARAGTSKDGSRARPTPLPQNPPSSASPAAAPGNTVPGSLMAKPAPPPPTASAAAADTTGTKLRASRRPSFMYSVIAGAIGLGAILATVAAVLAVRRRRPATAKQKTPADDQKKVDRRELYAQVNGREIALGPLAEVRRLEIGSSPRAAISVAGDGLLPQHVVLRREGEVFRLRNLSRKPITANGVTVPPRRRLHLVLPTDIVLNDKVKVTLETRLPTEEEPQVAPEGGAQ